MKAPRCELDDDDDDDDVGAVDALLEAPLVAACMAAWAAAPEDDVTDTAEYGAAASNARPAFVR